MDQPILSRMTIYPIKSLDGLELPSAAVLAEGALVNDRRFALVDGQGRYVNGKRTAAVNRVRARFDLEAMEVRLGGGSEEAWAAFSLTDDHDRLGEWFSDRLGTACRFVENSSGGFPDDRDAAGPTLVSTATLHEVAGWFAGLDLDETRRRFRANLEIDGVAPFWEDRLVGASRKPVEFRIGAVRWLGLKACQRCVVPSRSSQEGEPTHGFQKSFTLERERTLPAWAPAEQFDHFYRLAVNTRLAPNQTTGILHVGDAVSAYVRQGKPR
jgi:MOSC domain-containing protein